MRLPDIRPLVYLITDGKLQPGDLALRNALVERLRDAALAGVHLIQIREKQISTKELYELTILVVEALKGTGARVLINGRPDVAAAAGADGVHLPSDGMPASEVRRVFPDLMIGISTHTEMEIAAARVAGVDFAVFGPVFASPGKDEGVGVERLSQAVQTAEGLPIIALGGINELNYQHALDTGAAGFAAIRALRDPVWIMGIRREL